MASTTSTRTRIVACVVADASVARGCVRTAAWMAAFEPSGRVERRRAADGAAGAGAATCVVLAQLSGAVECGALDGALLARQLPGACVSADCVLALRVRGALAVFRVLERHGGARLDAGTHVRLATLAEHVRSADSATAALHAAALDLHDAVLARRAAGGGVVLLSGARGAGKSRVLALLRSMLAPPASQLTLHAVELAALSERELARRFAAHDVVLIDDLFAADDAPVWRALAALPPRRVAVVATTLAALPRDLAAATVLLRKPQLDAALLDSLPALTRSLPPPLAARATAFAARQLRRQRDDRGLGGHDLASGVRRVLLQTLDADAALLDAHAADADSFAAIPGYEATKAELRELLVWPLAHADALARLGVTPARGVLLEGPSGCGKTLLATALLRSLPFAVFAVKASDLLSRYLGGTERAIRDLFARARRAAPSVVWLDEIDVLAASRDQGDGDDAPGRRALSALLAELDGVGERDGVLMLAATSRLGHVDSALLRPGRFDRVVRVALPTLADRIAIIGSLLRRAPAARLSGGDVEALAARSDGQTCAQLVAQHREAAFSALADNGGEALEAKHFEQVH